MRIAISFGECENSNATSNRFTVFSLVVRVSVCMKEIFIYAHAIIAMSCKNTN
jgi:hypothetical protein